MNASNLGGSPDWRRRVSLIAALFMLGTALALAEATVADGRDAQYRQVGPVKHADPLGDADVRWAP